MISLNISLIILTFLLSYHSGKCEYIQDLNGDWLLKDTNKKYVDLKAQVPGGIYTDLMNNGIIGDIFFGFNDTELKWVPRLNWTYYRNFTVDVLQYENVNLIFEGLDTYSEVYVNNEQVGVSKNMFVQYVFNITQFIKPGLNSLEVRFVSPVDLALKFAKDQSALYPIPQECPPDNYNGECHVNMLRKMQASFSWDWGPSFPSVGIWKNVYIESFNETAVRYVTVRTEEKDRDNWSLFINIDLANNRRSLVIGGLEITTYLNFENVTKLVEINERPNSQGEIIIKNNITIPKGYVNTWWPNGYGAHDLYNVLISFKETIYNETSSKTLKFGFKTVELIQDELDTGLSFYFKINNIPIFMKGSNLIPIDILPEKGQNRTTVTKLLSAAHDSHMNMIRVWGGGVYESDYFYELANELGILIWQDFMFACSMYPADNDYLSLVKEEVRHQVKRLGHYTNIALWSGNNENEGFLASNALNTNNNFTLYKNDYVKLYVDTIKTEFDRIIEGKGIFVTSSPTNGKESDNEGYVAQDPSSQFYGDVHYYNYLLNSFDSNIYPVPRFASEYGYQSLPSKESFLTATNNISDLYINSMFMIHRQHHPVGNAELLLLIAFQFMLPDNTSSEYAETVIYYSQIIHAMGTKIQTEHYRRYRSILDSQGRGNTMGALYWQLNDVWIAPTWSGIDYTGKWKMLQYYAQEFFSPIIITGHIDVKRTLNIYIVSDLLSPIEGVNANISLYKWDSFDVVFSENFTLNLEPGVSNLIMSVNIDDYLSNNGCGLLAEARKYCFVYLSVEKDNVKITPDNFVLPTPIKQSNFKNSNVTIDSVLKISDENIYQLKLSTNVTALFVWMEAKGGGTFSENGFLMNAQHRDVYFYAESQINSDELIEYFTVKSVINWEINKK